MRVSLAVLLCLLFFLGPAAAEEEKNEEPKKPAKEMTEAERAAAMKRAGSLVSRFTDLYRRGKPLEALPLAREALALREQAYGAEHRRTTVILNNLAMLLQETGQFEEAQRLHERALRIREKTLGPDHSDVAASLHNLATVLFATGHYEQARPFQERALFIQEKSRGPEDPRLAASLNNLSAILLATGQYEQARALQERSLSIYEKALGPQDPRVAWSLNGLARLLHAKGQYRLARPLYERALLIFEAVSGPEHPDVALTLNALSGLLRATGRSESAREVLERSLSILKKVLGSEHPYVAMSSNSLAALHEDAGNYEEAKHVRKRALRTLRSALGENHPAVARSLDDLSELLRNTGQFRAAGSMSKRCLDIMEQHLRSNLAGLQASERLALARGLRAYLNTWLGLASRLGDSGYAEALRFKGLVARSTAAEGRLARRGGAEAVAMVEALCAAERRLSRVANSPPSFRDKEKKAKWQQAYAKAATEREELALALARDFAALRHGHERLDIELPNIQAALPPNAVLVDYLRSGDQYIAWVVPHEGDVKRADLGKAEDIDAAAVAFAEQSADSDEAAWTKAGKTLRDLILKPVEAQVGKNVTTLHLCPDAALAAVPFGALPSANGKSFLGIKFTISTISMAQDLVPWKDAPKPGDGALLLGGVDYGNAAEPSGRNALRAFVDRAPRGGKYLYLSGTKAEVVAIKSGMGTGAVTVLGPDATEAMVRSASKGKRIIHFATHGFVRNNLMRGLIRRRDDKRWLGAAMERQLAAGHDPMNLSGLAMAGANTRKGGGDDDGILTALEASHLDLDGVELVVLSACQTALGTAESGEGVIGLVRGFQMAGAKQVIGSLWKVDDDATNALMVKMYELWAPKDGAKRVPAAVALRKAQEYVRSQEKWKHPYYWAAWVIWGVGD